MADVYCRSNVCLRRHVTICALVTHQPDDFSSAEFSEQSSNPWATPHMGGHLTPTTRSWGPIAKQDERGCLVNPAHAVVDYRLQTILSP